MLDGCKNSLDNDCGILVLKDIRTKSDLKEMHDGLGGEGFGRQMQSWEIMHIMGMIRVASFFAG